MKVKRTQKYYLQMVQDTLVEITKTPKSQPERFAMLKKKAEKYLKRAKEFESPTQPIDRQVR